MRLPVDDDMLVAYFSLEFGIDDSLRIYSGGLGVLAGDHLKSASELGLPLVAVGLFYRHGYFRQGLDSSGWQLERYPDRDPFRLPVRLERDDGRRAARSSASPSPGSRPSRGSGAPTSAACRSTCSTPTSTRTRRSSA